jgi:hypothetical protein
MFFSSSYISNLPAISIDSSISFMGFPRREIPFSIILAIGLSVLRQSVRAESVLPFVIKSVTLFMNATSELI